MATATGKCERAVSCNFSLSMALKEAAELFDVILTVSHIEAVV